jgi:hypothetical protein
MEIHKRWERSNVPTVEARRKKYLEYIRGSLKMELELALSRLRQDASESLRDLLTLQKQTPPASPNPEITNVVEDWEVLATFLDTVLYETCTFMSTIEEKYARNIALYHPLSLWLHKHVRTLSAACRVGMILMSHIDIPAEKLPQCLIRLPNLIMRFNLLLLPHIEEHHVESLKHLDKEYLDLLLLKK